MLRIGAYGLALVTFLSMGGCGQLKLSTTTAQSKTSTLVSRAIALSVVGRHGWIIGGGLAPDRGYAQDIASNGSNVRKWPLPPGPSAVVATADATWIADPGSQAGSSSLPGVTRIKAGHTRFFRSAEMPRPIAIGAANDAVWVLSGGGSSGILTKLALDGSVAATLSIPGRVDNRSLVVSPSGQVWVVYGRPDAVGSYVIETISTSARRNTSVAFSGVPTALTIRDGSPVVSIARPVAGRSKVVIATLKRNQLRTLAVVRSVVSMSSGTETWFAGAGGWVSRIDRAGERKRMFHVTGAPLQLAFAEGNIWVITTNSLVIHHLG